MQVPDCTRSPKCPLVLYCLSNLSPVTGTFPLYVYTALGAVLLISSWTSNTHSLPHPVAEGNSEIYSDISHRNEDLFPVPEASAKMPLWAKVSSRNQ